METLSGSSVLQASIKAAVTESTISQMTTTTTQTALNICSVSVSRSSFLSGFVSSGSSLKGKPHVLRQSCSPEQGCLLAFTVNRNCASLSCRSSLRGVKCPQTCSGETAVSRKTWLKHGLVIGNRQLPPCCVFLGAKGTRVCLKKLPCLVRNT